MPIILPHWSFHRESFARVEAFQPDLVHVMSPGVLAYFAQLWERRHGVHVVASYETDITRYLHYYGFGVFAAATVALSPLALQPLPAHLRPFPRDAGAVDQGLHSRCSGL